MDKSKLTPELLQKAGKAATPEELKTMAQEYGMPISDEEAGQYFASLHKSGELSDEEIDNVSGGGCGGEEEDPNARCKEWEGIESVFGDTEYLGCGNCNYYQIECTKGHKVYHK